MGNDLTNQLTAKSAAGMTDNERLFVSGLIEDFDSAINRKDKKALTKILNKDYLADESINAIVISEL
jgi:hypothetical protein